MKCLTIFVISVVLAVIAVSFADGKLENEADKSTPIESVGANLEKDDIEDLDTAQQLIIGIGGFGGRGYGGWGRRGYGGGYGGWGRGGYGRRGGFYGGGGYGGWGWGK